MTARFRKKARKYRGTGGRGWGGKKKHRGGGSRGGKGWAGARGHRKTFLYAYARNHLGYRGFQPPKAVTEKDVVINIEQVDRLARKEGKDELNLGELGYTKLLAKGSLSKSLRIKVTKASASAKKKVEEAGGKLEAEIVTGGEEGAEAEAEAGAGEKAE